MKNLSKQVILILTISLIALVVAGSQFLGVSPAIAQRGTTPQDVPAIPVERPFQLPFLEPPGPDTWLPAQPYGNTTGAYRQRFTTYGLSGGIHFGVDLSAPCGTEVAAIADGIVFAVDGPFGSPPHNLMIDHPQLGYASMYGHLLQPPDLRPGQRVSQGEIVALTGDSRETCYDRPHLHLEIRDLNHVRKFNPATLIEANWDNLNLIGNSGRDFARDLTEPRKWQVLYDQPEARTGGPIINDFDYPWPFDWDISDDISALVPPSLAASAPLETQPLKTTGIGRQITAGNCCTHPYWNQDSTQVRFIDQPQPDAPLGIWGVDVTQSELEPQLVTERLGIYSPDQNYIAYPNRRTGVAVVERLATGQTVEFDTQEDSINFTPDGQRVMWTTSDEDVPRERRVETLWLADIDGSNVRAVFGERRTNRVSWLTDDTWLMSRGFPRTSDIELFTLSIEDGRQTSLMMGPEMRGETFSPDKRYMVYSVSFEPEIDENGLWILDFQNQPLTPQKLPFFGTYRWRDNERLIYVPFEPEAIEHNFYEYNVTTGQTRPLFPAGTNLTIANNDWRVSPDGKKIALVAAEGTELDGIWVLDID